jgi:hypothetical protein
MNDPVPTSNASPPLTATAREVLARADAAGVPIRFLGFQPLFRGVRAYAGVQCDWVVAAAADDPLVRRGELAIPKVELRALRRMLDAGLDCQAIYLAHEIPKGRLSLPSHAHEAVPAVGHWIAPGVGELVVDRVPEPRRTATIARHVGDAAGTLLALLARVRPIGHAARWTASEVAGAGLGSAAAALRGLDPVVFGAWTDSGRTEPGIPAAFFELVRFTY